MINLMHSKIASSKLVLSFPTGAFPSWGMLRFKKGVFHEKAKKRIRLPCSDGIGL